MYIGIDDTDSREGMCTTYLAALIVEHAECENHPRLIRLNPNIPYKTRGNGALNLVTEGEMSEILELFANYSHRTKENTNPGIVFMEKIPSSLKKFALRALHKNIEIKEALEYVKKHNMSYHAFGNKRGLIGALAAVGMELHDHTYELITYREPFRFGTERDVDTGSVITMDREYYPAVFDSYDYKNEYLCIAPHSPCPVLYGLRGESPEILRKAQAMVESENMDKQQIFLTNQATDMHLVKKNVSEVEEFDSVIVEGRVSETPHTIEGGHVIFRLKDDEEIFCAAYEPTKEFRAIIRELIKGDYVRVYGGVKYTKGLTINLEKIEVVDLVPQYKIRKRTCTCGGTFKSRGGGVYKCKKCGKKARKREIEEKIEISRGIEEGLYEVPPIARRHLAKPLCRYEQPRRHSTSRDPLV